MAAIIAPIFSLSYTPTHGQPVYVNQFTEGGSGVTQSSTELKKIDTLAIPTSDTVIDLSALSTLGKIMVQNLDTVNYVEFGPTSAGAIVPMVKLKPGEFAWMRLSPGITLRGRANTSAVDIDIFAFND